MGSMETLQPAPPAAVLRVLALFDRDQLAGFIAVAIDLLDLADGDSDVEPNGDEEDSDGDERGDPSYIEWHTRGRHKADRHGAELLARDEHGNMLHEDAEDDDPAEEDDPAGVCDEDGINYQGQAMQAAWHRGPGCPISDPGEPFAYGAAE